MKLSEAKQVCRENGFHYLLSASSPKIEKSNSASDEYYSVIQYFAPAATSGHNVCTSASAGCIAGCLHTAGIPFLLQAKTQARIARTRFFRSNRALYLDVLAAEIEQQERLAKRIGRKLAVRLNGTSDIVWERVAPQLFERFSGVQFYDYTKHVARRETFANYDLTISRSETNEANCLRALDNGARVACVFSPYRGQPIPSSYLGFDVVDGDKHDMTFLQPRGVWVGLRAKGLARNDDTGFVVQVA